jgi:hypothetical protein
VYSGGSLTSFDYPGASLTEAYGINDSGVVVGSYIPTGSGIYYSYTQNGTTYTTLNVPGATTLSEALGINSAGTVVGAYIGADSKVHGYIDNGGSYSTFDVPGSTSTYVYAINNHGDLAGVYNDSAGQHGYVDIGGVITTLDVPGAGTTSVYGLNDADVVSGTWIDSNFNNHGFIATQAAVPEPSSLALFAIGAAALLLRNVGWISRRSSTGNRSGDHKPGDHKTGRH